MPTPVSSQQSSTAFTQRLLQWHQQSGRKNLPWQQGRDAYAIWVSEIMLQQTQVQTVIPYYQRFMQRFPHILALATATEDEVLHHWSGLGYYARARNLQAAAKVIQVEHKGCFPESFEDVLALPGIGQSTAGAILAFAYGQHHAILDGNVKRVLSRYHGIKGYPGIRQVQTQLWQLAEQHTPSQEVKTYTQAIMDLGASCCTRSKPKCDICPQISDCFAYQHQQTAELPHRKPKATSRRKQAVYMLVIINAEQQICLFKRPAKGIWGSLHSFLEFENFDDVDVWISQHIEGEAHYRPAKKRIKHSFTHFDLSIMPLYLRLTAGQNIDASEGIWLDPQQPQKLGLPTPVQTIIDSL